jgi:O-antigen/teichoic acid export membrane protein
MSINITRVSQNFKSISKLLSDKSLTKKASFNALASTLDYFARLAVGFLVTPLLVAGLGDFYYGVWQILIRMVGYITPAGGRPTQALKFTLANQQAVTDYDQKQRHVGSAVAVWVFFLPIMTALGAILAWFVPYWINAPLRYFWYIRMAAGILVLNLALTNLTAIPQAVLEGENLGYKRMGMSAALVFVGGGFTWLALYLNTGIIGVAIATLAITLVTGLFWLQVGHAYIPWFGIARPSLKATRDFLGLSWWFMGWNLIMILMTASDVVVLGILNSVESVTDYTLTKYAPETLLSLVAIMAFGVAPGLGGIIGSGDLKKAGQVRGEMMSLTWLIVTVLGSAVLLWNRLFLKLWVGERHFVGALPDLLIVVVVIQLVLIRNDSNFIDLTLRLRNKVILGALSVGLSLALAAIFVGYFKLGVVGLSLGFIIGRLILTIGYPTLVGRFLGDTLYSQLKNTVRPVLVTVLLFIPITMLTASAPTAQLTYMNGWIELILLGGITVLLVFFLTFFTGLSTKQQKQILTRIRIVLGLTSD